MIEKEKIEKENYLVINQEQYGYDVLALMKSFYPEEQLRLVIPESREEIKKAAEESGAFAFVTFKGEDTVTLKIDGKSYTWVDHHEYDDFKEGLGIWLYDLLKELTGKELPWGTLSGVRPTKLAYKRLEEGKSDAEIVAYYKDHRRVSDEKALLSIDIAKREKQLMSTLHLQDGYSLYIGIPFCPSTCLYCSFTSFPIGGYRKVVDSYLDALMQELDAVAEMMGGGKDKSVAGKILDTVYIGGGTPTTLEPEQLERLLGHLRETFDFSTVQEFTVEAGRADSITREKLEVLKRYGVTRISVNPQTFEQKTLDFIGRKATAIQTEETYRLARELGFDNINMDLILGLPGEGEEEVSRTLEKVKELNPDSLTVHSLAIKRASKLAQWIRENGIEALNNTDSTMEIAAKGAEEIGLLPYYLYRQKNMSGNFENVGYAREGKLGIYNILIIEDIQSIVACGAGTVTKRVDYQDGEISGIERCDTVKDVTLYISKIEEMIERKRQLFSKN